MKTLNPMNPQNAGAVNIVSHNLKTYTSVTQLGFESAENSATAQELFNAMPDGAELHTLGYFVKEVPNASSSVHIVREEVIRGYAECIGVDGTQDFLMRINATEAGGLTGTWANSTAYLKTFTSTTQLGITHGTATTAQMYDAMPNSSYMLLDSADITDAPETYGTLVITKRYGTRGFAKFVRSGGVSEYTMFCNTGSGGLTGTWVNNAIKYKDYTVSVNLKQGFNTVSLNGGSNLPIYEGYTLLNTLKWNADTAELRNYIVCTPAQLSEGRNGNIIIYSNGTLQGNLTFRCIYVKTNFLVSF